DGARRLLDGMRDELRHRPGRAAPGPRRRPGLLRLHPGGARLGARCRRAARPAGARRARPSGPRDLGRVRARGRGAPDGGRARRGLPGVRRRALDRSPGPRAGRCPAGRDAPGVQRIRLTRGGSLVSVAANGREPRSRHSPRVLVVGAGIGGIATAIELRRAGIGDVTILERASDLGGTWFYNTYPGAACDVPSHLYSLSYAQRRNWSRLCSPQREIYEYLHEVAARYGVEQLVRTGQTVTACSWDEGTSTWTVETSEGERHEADAIVLATGQLHQPHVPLIQGAGEFAGHAFHSSSWDHSYDLRGKRVGVIGTGASAVQFVPEIAPKVRRLTVFQRTGNWFLPRKNKPYPALLRMAFEKVPRLQDWRRRFVFEYSESLTLMIRNPRTFGRL